MTLSGCGDDESSPTGSGGSYSDVHPLKMGNWWVSRISTTTGEDSTEDYLDTLLIDTTFIWGGNVWFGSKKDPDIFKRNDPKTVSGIYT